MSDRLEQLTLNVARCAERVADAEQAIEAASGDVVEAKREWRRLVVIADVDGDTEAQARADELERVMASAELRRERVELVLGELRNRLRQAEGELERYRLAERPMRYYRRRPQSDGGFGPLSNWAYSLRGMVPIGSAGGWESITEDRARYVVRQHPAAGDAWRALREGRIVHTWDWDIRAEAAE